MDSDSDDDAVGNQARMMENEVLPILRVNAPLYVCSDATIIMEAFHPNHAMVEDFLVTIAEPITRPQRMHEFKMTAYSLYAAVSVGMTTNTILDVLERFSKTALPLQITNFIKECTYSYGKVKLVLKRNRYYLESGYPEILRKLLVDEVIKMARVKSDLSDEAAELEAQEEEKIKGRKTLGEGDVGDGAVITIDREDEEEEELDVDEEDSSDDEEGDEEEEEEEEEGKGKKRRKKKQLTKKLKEPKAHSFTTSFEISSHMVEEVKKRCVYLDFPLMEEYDFRQDFVNANLEIDLSPKTTIRDYQEKCLSKMFGGNSDGRARSGIIVLPTGAGKTLVGITAIATIKKSTIILCTNAISVEQWSNELKRWSTIQDRQISKFTANSKEKFSGEGAGIVISTYTMISFGGRRAYDTQKMIEFVNGHEWGLMILDEVHVVPANVFRRVLTTVAAHTKLGLTATLVREDDKIEDLNFLIGPKLYEANWMDLANRGHIAKVEATEIWCPMTGPFYQEYLAARAPKRRLLCAVNPAKFMAAQYLIKWREAQGDKIIVFSDNVFALQHYAIVMGKPFIYGATSHEERSRILNHFRQGHPLFRTIFLSKVGDTSLDLPEATCLVQISSQFGSRRQEAQRMGRILRAKRRNEEGFKSRFYTLVAQDTDEVLFSSRRRRFLVDQGYEFHVIPDYTTLIPKGERDSLKYFSERDQQELLYLVKQQSDEACLDEVIEVGADDLVDSSFDQGGSSSKKGKKGSAAAAVKETQAAKEKRQHSLFKKWASGR